jgi:uncharacterized protein YndB with AHSA1/START domain
MTEHAVYEPGPAAGARVIKGEVKWTLVLERELRHAPELVWEALTDPSQLREWSPFEVDGKLDRPGATVKLTWVGTANAYDVQVTRAEPPRVLEFGDIRWKLEPLGGGTRLTLWHNIDRRFIAWGTAGWHVSLEVLDHLLAGTPIGRAAGADPAKNAGWQRLVVEYAKLFGVELPKWTPKAER